MSETNEASKKFNLGIIKTDKTTSLSPQMHNAALKKCKLDGKYVELNTSVNELKNIIEHLAQNNFRGANVTVPFKEDAISYLDTMSSEAKAIHAVNTIVVEKENKLHGYNTDAQGFINDLKENKVTQKGKKALIIGAGGAAKAIAFALLKEGAKEVVVANRTFDKAEELCVKIGSHFPGYNIHAAELSEETVVKHHDAHLFVNCTTLGAEYNHAPMPWPVSVKFKKSQVVYDINYVPQKTDLLLKAEKDGAKALNGLGLLVHQGALSFKLWTGKDAPIDEMKKALQGIKNV